MVLLWDGKAILLPWSVPSLATSRLQRGHHQNMTVCGAHNLSDIGFPVIHRSKELPSFEVCCAKFLLTLFFLLFLFFLYPKSLVSLVSITSPLALLMQCIFRMPCTDGEASQNVPSNAIWGCVQLFNLILSNNHTY